MSKIIIHIKDGITDNDALIMVRQVVDDGMISETAGVKQYCFATTWKSGGVVYATRSKKSGTHTFYVGKQSPHEE